MRVCKCKAYRKVAAFQAEGTVSVVEEEENVVHWMREEHTCNAAEHWEFEELQEKRQELEKGARW